MPAWASLPASLPLAPAGGSSQRTSFDPGAGGGIPPTQYAPLGSMPPRGGSLAGAIPAWASFPAPLAFAPVMEQFIVPHAEDVLAAIKRTVGK